MVASELLLFGGWCPYKLKVWKDQGLGPDSPFSDWPFPCTSPSVVPLPGLRVLPSTGYHLAPHAFSGSPVSPGCNVASREQGLCLVHCCSPASKTALPIIATHTGLLGPPSPNTAARVAKTTELHFPTVLETTSLRSRCRSIASSVFPVLGLLMAAFFLPQCPLCACLCLAFLFL